MMVTGMPRLCAPKPLDKHRSDGLKGLWPRAWRVWLQRVLDSGVLRVEHCPPGNNLLLAYKCHMKLSYTAELVTDAALTDRQIVIQILEEDYSLTDEHYGLAYLPQRKPRAPGLPPSLPTPSASRSTLLDLPVAPAPIPTVLPQSISPPTPPSTVLTDEITVNFINLLGWCS